MTLQNELREVAQAVQSDRPHLAQRLCNIAARVGRMEMQCDDIAADAALAERMRHEALVERTQAVLEFHPRRRAQRT